MTLGDNKKIALALIEEYSPTNVLLTDDADISKRINLIYNTSYFEIAQLKKIRKVQNINKITSETEYYREYSLPYDMYQLESVVALDSLNRPVEADYHVMNKKIFINDKSDASYKVIYYAYPTEINEDTEDDFELELDQDAQNLLPYAVVSDILKADPSANYVSFENVYNLKKKMLDTRVATPSATTETNYHF